MHNFCQFFTLHKIVFIFSIAIVHNLNFSFVVADLLPKLSYSKRLCRSKKQLYYVTVGRIL